MGQMGREKRLVIIQILTFYLNLNIYNLEICVDRPKMFGEL